MTHLFCALLLLSGLTTRRMEMSFVLLRAMQRMSCSLVSGPPVSSSPDANSYSI